MCLPPGRASGHGRLDEQHERPSGWRPAATARSAATISSIVPPRWTVPPGAGRRRPRDRSGERPVDLEDAGPVAERGVARRYRGGSRSPAIPRACGRRVEQDGPRRRQVGQARRPADRSDLHAESAQLGHERRGDRRRAAADRPADGRGRASPGRARTSRSAAGRAGASSGRPARRTGPAPRLAEAEPGVPSAGRGPAARSGPSRSGGGARGRWGRGARASSVDVPDERPEQAPPASPVADRARRPSPRPSAPGSTARPPSNAWATGASGWTTLDPVGGRGRPSGRTATHQRQRARRRAHVVGNPGSVSSSVRRPAADRRSPRRPGPSDRPGQLDRSGEPVGAGSDDDGIERCGVSSRRPTGAGGSASASASAPVP